MYSVYCIFDPETQRTYVGACSDVKKRWKQHMTHAATAPTSKHAKNYVLYTAMRNAKKPFIIETISAGLDKKSAIELEAYLIIKWDTLHPSGFNMVCTGRPSNRKHTAVTKEKMGALKRGKKQSAEHIAALSAVRKGRVLTEEHKAKQSASLLRTYAGNAELRAHLSTIRTGRKLKSENMCRGSKCKNAILTEVSVDLIKQKIAKGATHAQLSVEFNVSKSTITAIAAGRNWAYVPGYEPIMPLRKGRSKLTEVEVKEIRNCINTGESIGAVAAKFNATYTMVWRIVKGQSWQNVL